MIFDPNNLDQNAVNLTKAIGLKEGGGKFLYDNHSGDAGTSKGAYQWQPGNFENAAKQYGLDPNDFSAKNQNRVAYLQVKSRLDAGLKPWEVASEWNSGSKDNWKDHSGDTIINGQKIHYDTPAYVQGVKDYYSKLSGGGTATSDATTTPTPEATQSPAPQPDNRTPYQKAMGIGETPEQRDNNLKNIGNVTEKVTGLFGMNPLLKGTGQAIANAMGTQDDVIKANKDSVELQTKLLDQIKTFKKAGKDTSRLEAALKDITTQIGDVGGQVEDIGTQGITNKEVVGSAVSTAATFIPGVGKGASLLTKVLAGGATGYAFDVGSNLQNKDKTLGQDFTPGLGTAVGAVLPFAGYLISSLTKKIAGFTAGTGITIIVVLLAVVLLLRQSRKLSPAHRPTSS